MWSILYSMIILKKEPTNQFLFSLRESITMSVETFFAQYLPNRLEEAFDRLPQNVVFAFFLGVDEWQLERSGEAIHVGPITEVPKDCEFHCSMQVFQDIIKGELNPTRAFLDGRLRLQGDLGLALQLQKVLAA